MKLLNQTKWLTILLSITILSLLYLSGCDSKSVLEDPTTTEDAAMSVAASPAVIEVGTQSVVVVSISGVGAGQEVTFTLEPASAGSLSRTIDTTDANGEAATVFSANTTGAVTVRANATVGGVPLTGSTGITINQSTQVGTGNINISSNPPFFC